jgi:hypothetical protein
MRRPIKRVEPAWVFLISLLLKTTSCGQERGWKAGARARRKGAPGALKCGRGFWLCFLSRYNPSDCPTRSLYVHDENVLDKLGLDTAACCRQALRRDAANSQELACGEEDCSIYRIIFHPRVVLSAGSARTASLKLSRPLLLGGNVLKPPAPPKQNCERRTAWTAREYVGEAGRRSPASWLAGNTRQATGLRGAPIWALRDAIGPCGRATGAHRPLGLPQ